jgi:peptidoglycan/xylan/chitin deacetylase (PgdA/CDA1 family)
MKLIHFPVITNINSPKILIYQDSWGSTIKMAESPYQPNEGIKKVPNRLAVLIISVKILTSNKCASSVMLLVVLSGLVLSNRTYGKSSIMQDMSLTENKSNIGNKASKRVILNFDDTTNEQINSVKPILDKYGFKGTFFPVCGWIRSQAGWEQITALLAAGMDVQYHKMSHPNLNSLSRQELDKEIRQTKQCFLDHRINTTVFAYPYGAGSQNSSVVDTVAQHYDIARSATYCCNENEPGNKFENRYSINSRVQVHISGQFDYSTQSCTNECQSYDNNEIFEKFVSVVNDQSIDIENARIEAIPIVVYHGFVQYDNILENKNPTDTSLSLFEQEMKYLHDEGFEVLLMRDLHYDQKKTILCTQSMATKNGLSH